MQRKVAFRFCKERHLNRVFTINTIQVMLHFNQFCETNSQRYLKFRCENNLCIVVNLLQKVCFVLLLE